MFDETIIPSFLSSDISQSPPRQASGMGLNFGEIQLRIGQVTAVIPPSSPKNRSGRHYEYEVLTFTSDGRGGMVTKQFYNCVVSDMFGSFADKVSYTPRKTTATKSSSFAFSKGSSVAVLCVNGSTFQPIIIGGVPNPNTPTTSEDLGHHLSFEFNGVQFNIDKDGQVAIKRRGPTNDDGTVVSGQEEGGGATVLMTTDGSVSVQSGNGNHVKVDLDATNGSLNLSCTEGVVINSGQYSMVQGENLATAITNLMTAIATNITPVAPNGPAIATAINAALGQFQSSSFLSAKNKVD